MYSTQWGAGPDVMKCPIKRLTSSVQQVWLSLAENMIQSWGRWRCWSAWDWLWPVTSLTSSCWWQTTSVWDPAVPSDWVCRRCEWRLLELSCSPHPAPGQPGQGGSHPGLGLLPARLLPLQGRHPDRRLPLQAGPAERLRPAGARGNTDRGEDLARVPPYVGISDSHVWQGKTFMIL